MKGLIKKMFGIVTVLLLMFFAGGCVRITDEAAIERSIKAGEQLTENEYGLIINYCAVYAQKAARIQKMIDRAVPNSDEYEKGAEAMTRLADAYPYADIFNSAIASCTQSEIGRANAEKVERYAPLEYFTAPSWAMSIPSPGFSDSSL